MSVRKNLFASGQVEGIWTGRLFRDQDTVSFRPNVVELAMVVELGIVVELLVAAVEGVPASAVVDALSAPVAQPAIKAMPAPPKSLRAERRVRTRSSSLLGSSMCWLCIGHRFQTWNGCWQRGLSG